MPKQDAPCMFCGGLPCVCDGGQKKKSSKRTVKASSRTAPTTTSKSPSSTPSVSAKDEIDFGGIPEPAKPKFKFKSHSERDLSSESALRIIREIVSEKDQRKIDRELAREYPQEIDRRIAAWRDEHGSKKS